MATGVSTEVRAGGEASRLFEAALGATPLYALLRLDIHASLAHRACAFCGCLAPAPAIDAAMRRRYLRAVARQMAASARRLNGCGQTASIAFGAGAPFALRAQDVAECLDTIESELGLTNMARIGIELLPEDADPALIESLCALGVTAVTLYAIDRSDKADCEDDRFEQLEAAIGTMRAAGIDDVGVAYFTDLSAAASAERRTDRIVSLAPDRISAHSMSDRIRVDPAFRAVREPMRRPSRIAETLRGAGYRPIAPGRFVRPERRLEAAAALDCRLSRATIGFGVGALSHIGGSDFRNPHRLGAYIAAVDASGYGVELSARALPDA